MAYFSGVSYGNDEISSNSYIDDTDLNEDGETIRNFSGYDYHHKGGSYKPPVAKQSPPRKYTDPPRKLYDLWRLKTPTKIREGFNISEDSVIYMLTVFLIFVMIIYCVALYKMGKKLDSMTSDILQLLTVLKEGLVKK